MRPASGPGVSPRTVRWGGTLLPKAIGRAMEWPATAVTAACGGNRKLLLGQRPAGCKARSRADASAGCRNPYFASEENCPRLPVGLFSRLHGTEFKYPFSLQKGYFSVKVRFVNKQKTKFSGCDVDGIHRFRSSLSSPKCVFFMSI